MRYLTLTIFLMVILGFVGCGDTGDNGGESEAAAGATEEMTMEEAPMEEAPMEEMVVEEQPAGPPQWTILEQNVVHSDE